MAYTSSASRLRDFMNQADVLGLAKHVLLQLSCPRRQSQPSSGNQRHHRKRCPSSLECATTDLTNPCTQFQHLFSSATPSSASRLKDLMNQADALELANSDWLVTGTVFAPAKLPTEADFYMSSLAVALFD
eukprot:1157161-Pelagomonas_calceolata.AAC.14